MPCTCIHNKTKRKRSHDSCSRKCSFILYPLILIALICWYLTWTPVPKTSYAPLNEFSEQRARDHLNQIANDPQIDNNHRMVFSTGLDTARQYIIDQLAQYKEYADANDILSFEYELQQCTGVAHGFGDTASSYTGITNVILRITPANVDPDATHMLISAHLDSHHTGAGASDDAMHAAVMLEIARTLSHATSFAVPLPSSPLLLAFLGEEEQAGAGSQCALHHRWFAALGPCFNLESMGHPGRLIKIRELNEGGGISSAMRGHAVSYLPSAPDIYGSGIVASFTDLTNYCTQEGAYGVDLVYLEHSVVYHTELDHVGMIPAGAIQGEGDTLLAAAAGWNEEDGSPVCFDLLLWQWCMQPAVLSVCAIAGALGLLAVVVLMDKHSLLSVVWVALRLLVITFIPIVLSVLISITIGVIRPLASFNHPWFVFYMHVSIDTAVVLALAHRWFRHQPTLLAGSMMLTAVETVLLMATGLGSTVLWVLRVLGTLVASLITTLVPAMQTQSRTRLIHRICGLPATWLCLETVVFIYQVMSNYVIRMEGIAGTVIPGVVASLLPAIGLPWALPLLITTTTGSSEPEHSPKAAKGIEASEAKTWLEETESFLEVPVSNATDIDVQTDTVTTPSDTRCRHTFSIPMLLLAVTVPLLLLMMALPRWSYLQPCYANPTLLQDSGGGITLGYDFPGSSACLHKLRRDLRAQGIDATESEREMPTGTSRFLSVSTEGVDPIPASWALPAMTVVGVDGTVTVTLEVATPVKSLITIDTGDEVVTAWSDPTTPPVPSSYLRDRYGMVCLGSGTHVFSVDLPAGTAVTVSVWSMFVDHTPATLSLYSAMPGYVTRYAKWNVMGPVVYTEEATVEA